MMTAGKRGMMGRMMAVIGAVLAAGAGAAQAAPYYTPNSTTATLRVTKSNPVDGIYNYSHTEGPIYDGNGGILFCELNSQHANNLIWRFDIAAGTTTKAVSNSGGTQGMYYKANGDLLTADRDTRQISVRSLSNLSSATSVAGYYGSAQFNGPNDLVVDTAGGIYFTDPAFESGRVGPGADAVYYITAGGTVNQIATYGTTGRPNGIIMSPDHTKLYVGLWQNNVVNIYNVTAPGSITFSSSFTVARPDGMMIDDWGNLIITRTGGVSCYSPTGSKYWDVGTTSGGASNVEIWNNTLYITHGLSLYSVGLTAAPEPASVGVLGAGLGLLVWRRRRR